MNSRTKINAFLVDDEPLALKRLESLLAETGRVNVALAETDPLRAIERLRESPPDVLFLDIEMPGLTGFELLEQLDTHPPVIFTTAFDEHSLNAFEYFSVDYLLKPIQRKRLEIALDKVERISGNDERRIDELIREMKAGNLTETPISRISSRVGSKVQIIDVSSVTHFYSEDKVTFAATIEGKSRPVDQSLNSLEARLDQDRYIRIHRSTIVNLDYVDEVHGWFSGSVLVRLKNDAQTDLTVARGRVQNLKRKLGI